VKGYRLAIDKLESTMAEFGIVEIEAEGEFLDPSRMNAVDMEERLDVEEGTVVEVYVPGYMLGEEVFRHAQVKIAKKYG
jgi:molecular chaperone GrpE